MYCGSSLLKKASIGYNVVEENYRYRGKYSIHKNGVGQFWFKNECSRITSGLQFLCFIAKTNIFAMFTIPQTGNSVAGLLLSEAGFAYSIQKYM